VPYLDNIVYTTHAIRRIHERRINKEHVEKALSNGEVIEEYETDQEKRYLVNWASEPPLGAPSAGPTFRCHVVAADLARGATVVITVYDPREKRGEWSDDFRTRLD